MSQVEGQTPGLAATDLAIYLGFRVIPVFEPIGESCSCAATDCPRAGKHPRIKDWPTRASRHPEQIARWWSTYPEASIGIATGAESALLVLDVDERNGGFKSLDLLQEEFEIPLTLESRTGGGGKHLFFGLGDRGLGCSVLAPGIDVRGEGGLVVVPPSHHVSGRTYRWQDDPRSRPVAPIPNWLADELDTRAAPAPGPAQSRLKKPLSLRIENLLLCGDEEARYTSRSEGEQAIAAGARNADWTYDDFKDAILDPTNVGGRKAQQFPIREVERYLRRTWDTAGRLPQARRTSSGGIENSVASAQKWIEAKQWSGLEGQSVWSMAHAILGVIESRGDLRFPLSIREAAEASGLSLKTTAKALKSLMELGFISVVAEAEEGLATVYELHVYHTRHTGGHE